VNSSGEFPLLFKTIKLIFKYRLDFFLSHQYLNMSKIFKDLIPNKKTDTKQVLDLAKYSLEKQEKVTFTQDEIFNKKVALKKYFVQNHEEVRD